MKIVDARAITVEAVDPRDARFELLFSSGSHKFQYFLINPFLYDAKANSLLKSHKHGHILKPVFLNILKHKRYLLLGFSIFLNEVFTSR